MGIRYADDHIGMILSKLDELNILDETLIMVSADHGENQGELNVWGDHQTADAITCHIPLIVCPPSSWNMPPQLNSGLYYHFDWAATLLELCGGEMPESWDAIPFTNAFKQGESQGREYLVASQGAWACQRGVRFNHNGDPYILLRTYHDGYKMLDDLMLFNLEKDPHEQWNLANQEHAILQQGLVYLENWLTEMMLSSDYDVDPMMTVLRQGGGHHTQGELPGYLQYLQETNRSHHAKTLAQKHPDELGHLS